MANVFAEAMTRRSLNDDIKRMYEERLVEAMRPSFEQMDNACLREFLVDMCCATLSETPPSQEEWDQIRKRAQETAVEHAKLTRTELKKPFRVNTGSMEGLIRGKSASLLIST